MNIPVMFLITVVGMAGNLFARKRLSILASISLVCLLLLGRVADDILKTRPPDTALLLLEFCMVIFFMEADVVLLTFDTVRQTFRNKGDEISVALEARLLDWLRNQFSRQGTIAVGSLVISLALVPLAGLTSVSSGELPLTGALLLTAIIALLFLVTYRREPDNKSRNL